MDEEYVVLDTGLKLLSDCTRGELMYVIRRDKLLGQRKSTEVQYDDRFAQTLSAIRHMVNAVLPPDDS